MKAFIIMDQDYQTEQFERLHKLIYSYLEAKQFEIEETKIGRDDLTFCMGCFGCWIKKPGECVINDGISKINRTGMNSDVIVYLNPIIYGEFSANIKNAVDRWLPNMLPFFVTRPDGSTMHPPRYIDYPKQILIGYGDPLSTEDAQLFVDITKKHRSNMEVLVYGSSDPDIIENLDQVELKRVGGKL